MEAEIKKNTRGMIHGQPPAPKIIIPIKNPLIAPLMDNDFCFHAKEKIPIEMTVHTKSWGRVPWV